ncbi:hypothetical protein OESDEN_18179 [Oesophagostomum dentatum]|uniref:Uncharacterized protein n=1 Tax=Oesophagostomum dentatum TaxID=61180 RepID=A0A0B1SB76_OESDE|nr:hypothetical protein OESDEN_18179 [Oesophagostomum dentatum]
MARSRRCDQNFAMGDFSGYVWKPDDGLWDASTLMRLTLMLT